MIISLDKKIKMNYFLKIINKTMKFINNIQVKCYIINNNLMINLQNKK